MNLVTNLIALGLDAGILALCCEGVFGQKSSGKTRDLLLLPILFLLFIIPRVNVIAVREKMTASIPCRGLRSCLLTASSACCSLFFQYCC